VYVHAGTANVRTVAGGPDDLLHVAGQAAALTYVLILDNLAGHKSPDFVLWLAAHGIMPL